MRNYTTGIRALRDTVLPLSRPRFLCGIKCLEKKDMAQEKQMANIYGITPEGKFIRLAVFKKNGAIRLDDASQSHIVPRAHQDTVEGWSHEAAVRWGLRDLLTVPAASICTTIEKEQLALFRSTRKHGRRLVRRS